MIIIPFISIVMNHYGHSDNSHLYLASIVLNFFSISILKNNTEERYLGKQRRKMYNTRSSASFLSHEEMKHALFSSRQTNPSHLKGRYERRGKCEFWQVSRLSIACTETTMTTKIWDLSDLCKTEHNSLSSVKISDSFLID